MLDRVLVLIYSRHLYRISMSALKDLDLRMAGDPVWTQDYLRNLGTSQIVANDVHLVHVMKFEDFHDLFKQRLPTLLPCTQDCASKRTLQAQEKLGILPSLYFYAGRALPVHGGIALAFGSEVEKGHHGSATPFDTGGLAHRRIKSNLTNEDGVLRQFTHESMVDLKTWRGQFGKFLAVYFSSPLAYWTERPCKPDPEGIFSHSENQWPSWTFEVRFYEDQDIRVCLAWCCSEATHVEIRREIVNGVPRGVSPTPLQDFLEKGTWISPEKGLSFYASIESWIRNQVGL